MATKQQVTADDIRRRLKDSVRLATAPEGKASAKGREQAVKLLKGQDPDLLSEIAEEVGVSVSDVLSLVEGNYTPAAAQPSSGLPNQPPRASIGRATRAAKQEKQTKAKEEFRTDSARAFWGESEDDARPILEPTSEKQVSAALEVRRRSGRGGAAAKMEQDAVDSAEQAETMRPFADVSYNRERGPFGGPEDRSGPGGGRPGTQYDFDQFVEKSRKERKQSADDRQMKLAEMRERGAAIRDRLENDRVARYNDFRDGRTPVGGYGEAGRFFADIEDRRSIKKEAEALLKADSQRYEELRNLVRGNKPRTGFNERGAKTMPGELWDEYEQLKRRRARIGTDVNKRMAWAESQVKADRDARNQNMRTVDRVGTSPTPARNNADDFWNLNMSPEQEDTVSSVRRLLG